jgi:hypothetical protein
VRNLLSWRDGWQEAERAYLLWKARQVADQQGSGAVAVEGGWWEEEGEALDFAVNELKGDLFPDLMDYVGGRRCPQRLIPIAWSRRIKAWARRVNSQRRRRVRWAWGVVGRSSGRHCGRACGSI